MYSSVASKTSVTTKSLLKKSSTLVPSPKKKSRTLVPKRNLLSDTTKTLLLNLDSDDDGSSELRPSNLKQLNLFECFNKEEDSKQW